ncbi:hypothetical protein NitYY0826_C2052 [Nitratiruptor sp. YY08-26]|uniref:hypothetical protein n=1 Tax=unclassified Nitratiruptor TaxID=2624044 RepID=UPI0019163E6A|nr:MULTISPECIES: hypothetical protein [unclassified Nitratiruptor]BCD63155.1 hypothetical protein NitYY0813_C2050 [Nitratiruptor sp. YY08-13]BCD67091.1 hypothetical protein NitYY0826_C2052 [Nitratiruptor sp. YY08-26]
MNTALQLILFWVLFLSTSSVFAQEQWAKAFGGSGEDVAYSIQQTDDGGYILTGGTLSFGAQNADAWVLKLDSNGNVEWQKRYGESNWDHANSVQQTDDRGYIIAGRTNSFGGGIRDAWVIKLDRNGNVEWQKTYGESNQDEAYSVQQTDDGGYIVAGETNSFGGSTDAWVIKLDRNGNVEWQKTYGGSEDDIVYSIQQTSDRGYIVVGYTYSFGIVGNDDIWVIKLDERGNVQWQKIFYGNGGDRAYSVKQTSDNGYIVVGETYSFGAQNADAWVLKLDSNGNVEWQKRYGGSGDDRAHSVQQTSDNGYIVAGGTNSFGGGTDAWVIKLNENGNIVWQKRYGGSSDDRAHSIQQTSNRGYVLTGGTLSFGAGGGSSDVLVLKLDLNGNIPGCENLINETNVIERDTNASIDQPTTITTFDTNVSSPSQAESQNTNATITIICPQPSVTVPLSPLALGFLIALFGFAGSKKIRRN